MEKAWPDSLSRALFRCVVQPHKESDLWKFADSSSDLAASFGILDDSERSGYGLAT